MHVANHNRGELERLVLMSVGLKQNLEHEASYFFEGTNQALGDKGLEEVSPLFKLGYYPNLVAKTRFFRRTWA